jgi:hypothetical protein
MTVSDPAIGGRAGLPENDPRWWVPSIPTSYPLRDSGTSLGAGSPSARSRPRGSHGPPQPIE